MTATADAMVDHSTRPLAEYRRFLARKALVMQPTGVEPDPSRLHPKAHPFQRDLALWALRKGRAALFCDTGTGKTLMQLDWGRQAASRVLGIAPLAVCRQTIKEAETKWGIPAVYARSQAEAAPEGITYTNYEMIERFNPDDFGAVILDESSALKDHTTATRNRLIKLFANVPMRLCCTATPAPNDIAEIANHAEFLGVVTRTEMLAMFFVHDDEGWRLKRHARDHFYRWLASWGMSLRKPSDLGYSDEGYDLPPLAIEPVIVPTGYVPAGQLLPTALKGVGQRSEVRKGTLVERIEAVVRLVEAEPDEPWILWCGLNDESDELARRIPGALVVKGSQSPTEKAERIEMFAAGGARVLVTKPSIAAWGLNFQHCARMAFVGLSDSFESYYQAIRRCWRYGQTRSVIAHVVLTDLEEPIYGNVLRKEREAVAMASALVKHVAAFEKAELGASLRRTDPYEPTQPIRLPSWLREAA